MKTHLLGSNELICHHLVVRIASLEEFDTVGGLCATLRNRLQFAMSKVILADGHCSLFDFCKQLSLQANHELYKELENGFPPPFYLSVDNRQSKEESVHLQANDILTFSLVLIGKGIAKYFAEVAEALHKMCSLGLGQTQTQFELIDICEQHPQGESRLLALGSRMLSSTLGLPLLLSDYMEEEVNYNQIAIKLESPLCLTKPKKQRTTISGYQERSNGFPSFYQLVRSAAFRYAKLSILYADNSDANYYQEVYEKIEQWVDDASRLSLVDASIDKVCIKNPPQNKVPEQIPLWGYVGKMSFCGNYATYLPLLLYMQHLGVGNELTYGFGKYSVTVEN